MATKKRKGAYHHGDLRAALIDAARKEMHKVGWKELSLRSVARRAGVTHTAAYHHFKDKHALLSHIALEGFALLDQRMAEAMDAATAAGGDAVDRLFASGQGYLRMAQEDPQAYDLMFNGLEFEKDREAFGKIAARPFQRLVDAVAAARTASGRSRGDTLSEAMLHWEVVHGASMLARAGHFDRMGIDMNAHGRYLYEVLRPLYGHGRG